MAETKLDPITEAAKQRHAEATDVLAVAAEQYAARMKGKPTPTQEENDLAAHGLHVLEHEPDGGDPDPYVPVTRTLEAKKPAASYQTRQATPSAKLSSSS